MSLATSTISVRASCASRGLAMSESSAAEDVAFDAPGAVTGKCCKQKLSQPKIWIPANQPRLAPQPCGVSPLVFSVVSFTFPAAGERLEHQLPGADSAQEILAAKEAPS